MSDARFTKRIELLWVAVLLVAGCNASSAPPVTPNEAPVDNAKRPAVQKQVTFYLAGMNQKLQIL